GEFTMSEAEPTSPSRAAGAQPTLNDLIKVVLVDPGLTGVKAKKDLIDELRKTEPAFNDRWLYRYVVWSLGAVAILSVVGFVVLSGLGKDIPEGLVALGSAAIGGLAGLFTSSSRTRPEGK